MNEQQFKDLFIRDIEISKENFIKENLLDDFIRKEENCIRNNLEYLYSKEKRTIRFKINPFLEIKSYEMDETEKNKTRIFALVPKFLALQNLQIQYSELSNADLFLLPLINKFKHDPFYLEEVTNGIFTNNRDVLRLKVVYMIRKFLSYQYLLVDNLH